MAPKNFSGITVLFWIFFIGLDVQALTCWETNENGDIIEKTSEDFTYCVITPEHIGKYGNVEMGKAYGVGPASDSTSVYDKIFGTSNDMYQIISMCIFEKYDFSKISPRFSFKEPEFMLRCFCNFDKCNHEKNFVGYINNLKADSEMMAENVI